MQRCVCRFRKNSKVCNVSILSLCRFYSSCVFRLPVSAVLSSCRQLKKFATMKQESFRDHLGENEWPVDIHEPIIGHSVSLGQFSLLVKKDPFRVSTNNLEGDQQANASSKATATLCDSSHSRVSKKRKVPALETTDWCPPGTSTVWANEGSIHTCSDKLCRWNCLGLQGSLLAPLLKEPLHMTSLTVGRKLTECICRRAVCCRAAAAGAKRKKKGGSGRNVAKSETAIVDSDSVIAGGDTGACHYNYKINHPTIMGTQVYMDETGVIDMSSHHGHKNGMTAIEGEDVRFHTSLSWAWWPSIMLWDGVSERQLSPECIDGTTGWAVSLNDGETLSPRKQIHKASRLSTQALLDLFLRIQASLALHKTSRSNGSAEHTLQKNTLMNTVQDPPTTLKDLRAYKRWVSPEYEKAKLQLLTKHPIFRQWKRREELDP